MFEARQAESTAARTAGYPGGNGELEKATSELAVATGEFEASRKRLADTIRIGRLTADYGVFESVFIPDRNLESTRRKMLVRKMAARQADDLAIMTAAHQKAVAMEFVAGMERAQAWVLGVSQDALAKLQADTEAPQPAEPDRKRHQDVPQARGRIVGRPKCRWSGSSRPGFPTGTGRSTSTHTREACRFRLPTESSRFLSATSCIPGSRL